MNNEGRNVNSNDANNDSTVALTNVDNTTSGMQGGSGTHWAAAAHGGYTGTAFVDRGQQACSSQDNSVKWVTVERVANNDDSAKRHEERGGPQASQCIDNETIEARRENRGDRNQLEWRRRATQERQRLRSPRQREKHEINNHESASYYNLRSRTVQIRSLSPEGDKLHNERRRNRPIPRPDNDISHPGDDDFLTRGDNQQHVKKHGSGKKRRQSRLGAAAANLAEIEREQFANRKNKAGRRKERQKHQSARKTMRILTRSQQVFTAASFKGKSSGEPLFIPPGMADAASMSSFDEPFHPLMAVPTSATLFSSADNVGSNIDFSDGKPIPIPRDNHLADWDQNGSSVLSFGTNGAGAPSLGKRKRRPESQSPIASREARRDLKGSASS
ncbi:hypothetical protein SpCBS45565_g01448 [Spizellomyces sp. 'palustris']|nr:hypothetical protein SpCBS45565_g01448 [Spizellomyces sp. 'palustris']